jgi:hypothetical protein
MVPMIAQTNLQLYRQLRDTGIAESELARVRDAYELAVELFSGKYRKSHRAFVEHLVGTASIVADADGRSTMVLAALLHAAYVSGDWKEIPAGVRARQTVRQVVGTDVEELIWHYSKMAVELEALTSWTDAVRHAPSPLALDLVVLRLANQVEELQDQPEERPCPPTIAVLMEAARSLGAPEVADRLVDIAVGTNSLRIASSVGGPAYPEHVVLPRSARLSLRVRLRRARRHPVARRIFRRLRRLRRRG